MIICNCPRCDEGFRVPSGRIPEDAHARCPWCHESYPIADVLRHLPPKLEITSADGTPLSVNDDAAQDSLVGQASSVGMISHPHLPTQTDTIETIVESVPGDDLKFDNFQDQQTLASALNETATEPIEELAWNPAPSDILKENQAASFATSDSGSDWDQDSTLESMNLRGTSGGRARRKGAGIGTFIGILLGALASVPIAGFLLMLLGRTPDWGFWPFDGGAAPPFTRAASLPTPGAADPLPAANMKKPDSSAAGEPLLFKTDDETPNPDTRSAQADIDLDRSVADQVLSSTPSQQSVRQPTTAAPVGEPSVSDAAVTEDLSPSRIPEAPVEVDGPTGSASDLVDGTKDEGSKESPPSLSVATAAETALADSEPLDSAGQENAYSRTASNNAESAELAATAGRMIEKIASDETTPLERNRRLRITYMNIVKSAGLVDGPSESLRLLATVITSSPSREILGQAGWKWLSTENRETDGIALIGQAVVTDGKSELIDGAGGMVSLSGDVEVADGQKFLILGRMVEQGSALRVYVAEPIE